MEKWNFINWYEILRIGTSPDPHSPIKNQIRYVSINFFIPLDKNLSISLTTGWKSESNYRLYRLSLKFIQTWLNPIEEGGAGDKVLFAWLNNWIIISKRTKIIFDQPFYFQPYVELRSFKLSLGWGGL